MSMRAPGLVIGIVALCLIACGQDGERPAGSDPQPAVESFTFLGMGRETELSDRLRAELTEKLGNDAIEDRGMVDLDLPPPGILRDRLPALEALNRELNSPPGERVEHDRIKLMYRYARGKDQPFDLVELFFDPQTRKPLCFRMRSKGDDGTIESLRSRYGPPDETVAAGAGQALIWRKAGDSLVVLTLPDHFGSPVHHVAIFFAENLQRWAAAEHKAKPKPRPGGKPAF